MSRALDHAFKSGGESLEQGIMRGKLNAKKFKEYELEHPTKSQSSKRDPSFTPKPKRNQEDEKRASSGEIS